MKKNNKYEIELINEGSLTVKSNQTILAASIEAGIPHYHACGGKARCSTCRILVKDGDACLSEPNEAERKLASKMGFHDRTRLACQTKVLGTPITIRRLIKDDFDIEFFISSDFTESNRSLGEEKELVLFFIDIREFTPFIESHLPYDVIHILNRFAKIVGKSVESVGGKIIEVAGDGIYVVFGFDEELSLAVKNSIAAGYTIIDEIENLNNTYLNKHFDFLISVGIGINVGKVIFGNIGIGINNALSVIGYPVNIASRIQDATKELNNNFLISQSAYNLLEEPMNNISSKKIYLKGVKNPIKVILLGTSSIENH